MTHKMYYEDSPSDFIWYYLFISIFCFYIPLKVIIFFGNLFWIIIKELIGYNKNQEVVRPDRKLNFIWSSVLLWSFTICFMLILVDNPQTRVISIYRDPYPHKNDPFIESLDTTLDTTNGESLLTINGYNLNNNNTKEYWVNLNIFNSINNETRSITTEKSKKYNNFKVNLDKNEEIQTVQLLQLNNINIIESNIFDNSNSNFTYKYSVPIAKKRGYRYQISCRDKTSSYRKTSKLLVEPSFDQYSPHLTLYYHNIYNNKNDQYRTHDFFSYLSLITEIREMDSVGQIKQYKLSNNWKRIKDNDSYYYSNEFNQYSKVNVHVNWSKETLSTNLTISISNYEFLNENNYLQLIMLGNVTQVGILREDKSYFEKWISMIIGNDGIEEQRLVKMLSVNGTLLDPDDDTNVRDFNKLRRDDISLFTTIPKLSKIDGEFKPRSISTSIYNDQNSKAHYIAILEGEVSSSILSAEFQINIPHFNDSIEIQGIKFMLLYEHSAFDTDICDCNYYLVYHYNEIPLLTNIIAICFSTLLILLVKFIKLIKYFISKIKF